MSDTFDLMAFIDGSSYPRKKVTVYTNVAALKEAEELEGAVDSALDSDTAAELEAKLDLVRVDIEQSALVFELQGMPFRMAQEVADVFNDANPATDDEILELIQKSIQNVENAKGAKASVPDTEGLKKMRLMFSPSEFAKLISGTVEVNFSAATYEASVDAGFPVGSSDVE